MRLEIQDAIGRTDSELTPSVLDAMATAMRACGRELTATAPADARLRPLRTIVDEACAEYDAGAECLAAAADIRQPVTAGGADDRRLTEALDCGFTALNRGSELLVDAEIDADEWFGQSG